MTQIWHMIRSVIFLFLLHSLFLLFSCPVNSEFYSPRTDAIVIQAGRDAYDTHLVKPISFINANERTCLYSADGHLGVCTSLRSCYPSVDQMRQFIYSNRKAMAMGGTCQYVRQDDGQKVYGVCCAKDDSQDYDVFGQDANRFYQSLEAARPSVNPYGGRPLALAEPWLQQLPYTAQFIKVTTAQSEEDYDEIDTLRQSLICGAGPNKNFDNDWHRVVGGADAVKNSWPFMAALRFNGKFLCAASLISPTKLLTAAHCVSDLFGFRRRLTVDLGMHSLTPSDAQVTRRIRRIRTFWGYNFRSKFTNDIAILTMSSPVNFTSTISPVCLPPMGTREKYTEKEAAVIGWGSLDYKYHPQPTVLQEAILRILPNSICKDNYKKAGFRIADGTMLCARAPGKDACRGDSGGPLIVRPTPDSPWVQVGIVSFGIGCAREQYPGVFTRVSAFRFWIRLISGV